MLNCIALCLARSGPERLAVDAKRGRKMSLQVKAVRQAVSLNTPIGDEDWRRATGATFSLKRTFRSQGRPCKK